MSETKRRSFYFSEENMDLFHFLHSKKKKANEWVMDNIRKGMIDEVSKRSQTPLVQPSNGTAELELLRHRMKELESTIQTLSQPTQPTTPIYPSVPEQMEIKIETTPSPTPVSTGVKINYPVNTVNREIQSQPTKSHDPLMDIGSI